MGMRLLSRQDEGGVQCHGTHGISVRCNHVCGACSGDNASLPRTASTAPSHNREIVCFGGGKTKKDKIP